MRTLAAATILMTVTIVAACSAPKDSERVGHNKQTLTIATNVDVSGTQNKSEIALAPYQEKDAFGYHAYYVAVWNDPGSGFDWTVARDPGSSWQTPAVCGTDRTNCPVPSGYSSTAVYGGDPGVVTTGFLNRFVVTQLINDTGGTTHVAAIVNNGTWGKFTRADILDNAGTQGGIDQPAITIDYTQHSGASASDQIWVAWPILNGTTFGWTSLHYDSSSVPTIDAAATSVQLTYGGNNIPTDSIAMAAGAYDSVSHKSRVGFFFSDTQGLTCASGVTHIKRYFVEALSDGTASGTTWGTVQLIDDDPYYPKCVASGTQASFKNGVKGSIIYDRNYGDWLIAFEKGVQTGGSGVTVCRYNRSGVDWTNISPGCESIDYALGQTHCPAPSTNYMWEPSLAYADPAGGSQEQGRVVLSAHLTDYTDTTKTGEIAFLTTNAGDASPTWNYSWASVSSGSGQTLPWTPTTGNHNPDWATMNSPRGSFRPMATTSSFYGATIAWA